MKNYFDVAGKYAVVTGASSGLGRQFALCLAEQGCNVAIAARRVERLEEVKKEVEAYGVKCLVLPCDVTDTEQIRNSVDKVVKEFGRIDILINNAAASFATPVVETTDEQWYNVMKTNVDGVFFFAREVGKVMIAQNYGKIINEKHFDRINSLIDPSKTVCGGGSNRETLQIEPTVLDNVTFEDPVMQQEIFGPVLPVLTYDSLGGAVAKINSMAHPLALYIFTEDEKNAREVTSRCGFGGGCINDVLIHLATSNMGFGGFGESGMGSYHGIDGFRTFSHYKSIVDKKTWIDLPMRYQKYRKIYEKMVRLFMR